MKNSAGGAGGDERCGDDDGGGGGSASHGSITLVASQNGMTSPANQNSRQARANHHITDVGSKNNGGGGGNNAPTTGDGVPTRSKGGSVSAQPLADPSTGSTKAAAAKKRSAKTLDDEDTEDDAPTASTESSSRAKTNRNAKKGGNGGSAGATNRTSASITPSASAADRNSNKRSRSNGSGAAASAKTRSRGNGADDGAGGNAIPSAAVAASTASVIGPFAGASGDTTRGGRPRRSSTDKTLEKMAKVLKDEDAPIDDDDDVMMEECDGRGKKKSTKSKKSSGGKKKVAASSTSITIASNKSTTNAFVAKMTFAKQPPNKDRQLRTSDAPVCTDENCDDEECVLTDPSSIYAVGTQVELVVEGEDDDKEDVEVTGQIIFHPCPILKDGNNYLVETDKGVYVISIEDIDDYVLSSDDGDDKDDSDPKYGVGTMIERDWSHREESSYLARIVAIPCPGGCNGMCSDASNGMKCGGREAYLVEYLDDGYREVISPDAISDFVVGEAQDAFRFPPCPASLDVVDVALSMAGLSTEDDDSGSGGGDVEEVSAQPNYKRSTKRSIKTSLLDTNVVRVDPTKIDDCIVSMCKCGNTAQTKRKVKNKGPGQHPDYICWDCVNKSGHSVSSYIQNSAACLCCAERYRTFRNCKTCVTSRRCCRICEKFGCYQSTRFCEDCLDAGKAGAGKRCKACNTMGTYRTHNYCHGCYNKRNNTHKSSPSTCPRCLTSKTSIEYVPGPSGSNVCSNCYNGGDRFCCAWIDDGVLCNNVGAKHGNRRRALCNLHKKKCEKVEGQTKEDNRYFLRDEKGGFNEGWAHK